MRVRNRNGAITPAEGCMFAAVILFVILLVGILYIAFMRFRNPPPPAGGPAPAATLVAPAAGDRSVATARPRSTGLATFRIT